MVFAVAGLAFSLAVGIGVWAFLTTVEKGKQFQARVDTLAPKRITPQEVLKTAHPSPGKFYFENTLFFLMPVLGSVVWQQSAPLSGPWGVKLLLAGALSFTLKIAWKIFCIRGHRRKIEEALPGTLDLLVVCVEAGMSLTSALVRIAEETKGTPLSNELRYTFHEINVGLSPEDAFHNLAGRAKVQDVNALVTTMIESEKMGMRLGECLRNHAGLLRETIRMRTREKIQKLPVKMLFPLVFFILPAIFTVVLAPSLIKMIPLFKGIGS